MKEMRNWLNPRKAKQFQLGPVVIQDQRNDEGYENIEDRKHELHQDDPRKMLVQQMVVLGDIPVVEIGDPQVEKDIEKKGKIKDDGIEPVIRSTNGILYSQVNPKYPERLDQEVQ